MTFKKRIILSIPLAIIFAIVGTILISYSQGYRYDFKRKKLTKTGVLFINSTPENATISLNAKSLNPSWYEKLMIYKKLFKLTKRYGPTPTIINNLLPDIYEVTVEKRDYQKWEKELEIKPEKTTFVSMIQLFLKEPKIEFVYKIDIENFWLSPNKEKIVYLSKEDKLFSLKMLDFLSGKEYLVLKTLFDVKTIKWSKESRKILVIFSENYPPLVVDFIKKGQIIYLPQLSRIEEKKIKWDESGNTIWFQKKDNIYSLDLTKIKIRNRFNLKLIKEKGKIKDWLIKRDNIFLIKEENRDLFLEKIKLLDDVNEYEGLRAELKIKIPTKDIYFKEVINNKFLILSDKSKNHIYIIDLKKRKKILTKIDGEDIVKNEKNDNFLIKGKFGLTLLKLNLKNKSEKEFIFNTLCRFSQKINQANWFADTDYLIYSVKNQIWAIETDLRDKINRHLLLKPYVLKYFWVDKKTKNLFFIGEIKNKKGVFQAKIQ